MGMSYVFVELELNLVDFHNLFKVVELYSEMINAVPKENVLGGNFNKYWNLNAVEADPTSEEIFPHISVRFNLKDIEACRTQIIEKADELVRSRRTRFHGTLKEWHEPEFVVRAHELGTRCCLVTSTQLQKEQLYEYLKRDREKFLLHLLSEMLRGAGLKVSIPWTYVRPRQGEPPVELRECAGLLAKEIEQSKGMIHNPDFLERFLHAFLNCLGFSGVEGRFLNLLMIGRAWNDLATSHER